MTAFTFSAEQLRAAPPEVQRWAANEIARALGTIGAPRAAPPRQREMTLAACTVPEAMQIFELVAGDAIVTRLFFELGREHAFATDLPGLRALRAADLAHHVGLPDQGALVDGLATIDRAFHQAHGDRAGGLFGFDDAGHVYLHDATQASIRRVWEELVRARAAADREAARAAAPRTEGFMPPQLGPSEDIAAHAQPAHRENPLPL